MKNKVVVTGGAGFIGANLVKALKDARKDVEVIDIALDLNCDVRKLDKIRNSFNGAEYVFHLAALVSVPYSIEHPEETNETNLTGTVNVLMAARDAGVKRVVLSSSAAVYGNQEILPVKEDVKLCPQSPYALQKLGSEMYLRQFSELYNIECVSLRYFNVYGSGQNPSGPYASVIPKFIEQNKSGKPLTVVGDGTQTRDFVHVSDVVKANILSMESAKVGKGEAINIASGRAVSINDIAGIIGGPVEHLPSRVEVKDSLADISLAKNLLDWQPSVKLEDGLQELLK